MNRTVLIVTYLLCCPVFLAQPSVCKNNLDSAGVIKIAKKQHAYWTKHWAFKPQLNFNETSCEWTVHSTKSEHTNKGKCKHTNGCTKITSVVLIIDAETKKVKSKERKTKLYPNYE